MKKSLFTILSVFAFLCINISPSLSMDGRGNKLPDTFWGSLPGNFMSLGGKLENDLKNNEQEYEDFTMLPIHNGRQPSDVGFISAAFRSDSAAICTPCMAPSINPTADGFWKFLKECGNAGGNEATIEKFGLCIKDNILFENRIYSDITQNSYATIYLNYLSQYRGFK